MEISNVTSSKPKSIFQNASWNLGLRVWTTIVAFVVTPLLILRVGDAHFGLFTLLTSINGIMAVMNLGMSEATLRYVAHYYGQDDIEGINRIVGATLTIYLFTGLIGFLFLFLGSSRIVTFLAVPPSEYPLVIVLLKLTAINFCLTLINGVFDAIPKALERFDINSKVLFVQSIIQVLGIAAVLIWKLGVLELVILSSLISLSTLSLNYVIARRLIPSLSSRPRVSKKGLKEVFSYGVFSLITQVLGMVWSQVDRLLLGTFVSSSSVAYLAVPQTATLRVSGTIGTVGSVLFPRFSILKDKKELSRIFLNSTWALLFASIIVFVPLTILFPDLLRLWIGEEFSEKSARIGQIIACSCIVRGAFVPYDALFKGIGKPQYLSMLYFATGLTSLITNLILIPMYGLSGAGYAYGITLIWGFVAVYFAWHKVLGQYGINPIFRSVLLPISIAYSLLPCFEYIRRKFPPVGWIDLIFMAGIFMVITSLILMVVDHFANRESSNSAVLIKSARDFIKPYIRSPFTENNKNVNTQIH